MPTAVQRRVARQSLDRRFDAARPLAPALATPRGGWIRAIRDALGISSATLAGRLQVNDSTVRRIEQNERAGRIQLDTLARAADALGCDVVYALIPRQPLDATVQARALELAYRELAAVDHTMALEDQATGRDDSRAEALGAELIARGRLTWDE